MKDILMAVGFLLLALGGLAWFVLQKLGWC